ncbi:unnamed protein product [Tetraodon nigroviridis]|uniref:(spotted green pufferfish) hypothetical protein n=1 Tax=Tetraodon nigroviridis TaxID=99883 RepID=Q4SHA0_TETNG|nr:unnamed protein product [Tetraodon nigroviridis]
MASWSRRDLGRLPCREFREANRYQNEHLEQLPGKGEQKGGEDLESVGPEDCAESAENRSLQWDPARGAVQQQAQSPDEQPQQRRQKGREVGKKVE